jgi:hypothetical protein
VVVISKYSLGQEVYLKDDEEQAIHTVVGIIIRFGHIKYEVVLAGEITELFEFEINQLKEEEE